MGLAATKPFFDKMLCKNRVEDMKEKTVGQDVEVDEHGIPLPIKRMAWEMIPEDSKVCSVLSICQRPADKQASGQPPESSSSLPMPPPPLPLPTLSSLMTHPIARTDTQVTDITAPEIEPSMLSRKTYDAKNAFKAGLMSKTAAATAAVGEEVQKATETLEKTGEMVVEELDPQTLMQRAGLTTANGGGGSGGKDDAQLRLPDAISEVSSVAENEK